MRALRVLLARLRGLGDTHRADAELREEFDAHVAMEAEEYVRRGMPPDEALRRAHVASGGLAQAAETMRAQRGIPFMGTLAGDVRYALRGVRRAPVFSAVAIACLAAGIGVNATAFSVLDAFLFHNLPGVERQKDLDAILLSREAEWGRTRAGEISPVDWQMFRDGMPGFSHMAVDGPVSVPLRVRGEPIAVRADFVSGDFFAMLGTSPGIGRLLSPDDDVPSAPPVAVLGYDFWKREFGARPDVVGQSLHIGDAAFTIVGVTPEGFVGLHPGDLVADPEHGAPYAFLPLAQASLVRARSRYTSAASTLGDRWLVLVGRRGRGVGSSQIQAQAEAVASRIAAAYPNERRGAAAVLRPPSTATIVEEIAITAFVMAVPVLVLLVACANLANQLLARGMQRSREIAIRLSLGATRARLVRQLLVEATVIAVAGSAGGLVLARVLTDALRAFAMPLPFRIPIDTRVFFFTTALAFVTAAAFGLVPALRATRLDLAHAVKDGGHTSGSRRSRLRNTLVVTQVAASVALLALSALFVRASYQPRVAEQGNVDRLLTVGVNLDLLAFTPDAGHAFQARALDRLRGIPGVVAVGFAPFDPTRTNMNAGQPIAVAGDKPDRGRWSDVAPISGDWLVAQNMRLVSGRTFTAAEALNPSVAIVDEAAARNLWPDADALGQTIRIGRDSSERVVTVIGVAETFFKPRSTSASGIIFVTSGAWYRPRGQFYVRTTGDASAMRAVIRAAVREVDPRLPITSVQTVGETLAEDAGPIAQIGSGLGAMGAIALLLAALGLSAVLAFLVEQRRFEIGVRMALGATKRSVTWLVLRQALVLAVIGVVLGALIAGATATALRGMLLGLPPIDPLAFTASSGIMVAVALLSSAVPARRAATVDPLESLRAS